MNLTKEEIEEIKEALETHKSFLNRIVNSTDIRTTEKMKQNLCANVLK